MNIYSTDTMCFWGEHRSDGFHLIHEIDDDDFGLKSEWHFILSREAEVKLFSIISEKDFVELCRRGGTSAMIGFLDSNGIPYRRESF